MDILYLVDRLDNLIASSRRMPLVNSILLKETDILPILEQMRTSIPEEIKQARRVLQDRERILAQAQAEASTLLSKAREESERAINREGLLHTAEERSQALVRQAEEKTEQMKAEADAYAMETLHNLREHLSSIETEISRTILSIEKGLESLEEQKYEEIFAQDEEQEQENSEEQEEAHNVHIATYPTPRRASLANDTMGGPNF